MTIHGLGSPAESSGSTAPDTARGSSGSSSPSPGIGRDHTVVTLDKVPDSKETAIRQAYEKLIWKLLPPPTGEGDIYLAVDKVLGLMTGPNLSDQAVGAAADRLVEAFSKDASVADNIKREILPSLRALTDLWRERKALDYLSGDPRFTPRFDGNRDNNALKWIGPRTNEVEYDPYQRGHQIFTRLLAATTAKTVTPDKAAFFMARLYDASKANYIPLTENYSSSQSARWAYYISQDFRLILKITNSKDAIDVLEASLKGAEPSEDLTKARLLIAAYRESQP
jgi:hypothetical protein